MPLLTRLAAIALVVLSAPLAAQTHIKNGKLNLDTNRGTTEAFVKLRASLKPEDVFTWWTGSVFGVEPGKKPEKLFGFEGFNVARMTKLEDGGYQMLSREFAVYRDPKTNEILRTWNNPYTGEVNEVFHVQNDPVNHVMGAGEKSERVYRMPWVIKDNLTMVQIDVPLAYPSPLPVKDYPLESAADLYVGSEHFGFYADTRDLLSPRTNNIPMQLTWTRNGPWLPWMKMGQRPGFMMFVAMGEKLESFSQMSEDLQQLIRSEHPKFLEAPREKVEPNATTWNTYRDYLKSKKAE
jgi:hypothetical protein